MQVESSDLISYGLIPEFIGRFPVLVSLSTLNEDQLVQVTFVDSLSKKFLKTHRMSVLFELMRHFTRTVVNRNCSKHVLIVGMLDLPLERMLDISKGIFCCE